MAATAGRSSMQGQVAGEAGSWQGQLAGAAGRSSRQELETEKDAKNMFSSIRFHLNLFTILQLAEGRGL